MVALFITLDIREIISYGLNLNEYLTLMKLQHDAERKTFPFEPDPRYFDRLIKDGFIEEKIIKGTGYNLGPKAFEIFNGEDLFEEFFDLFPTSVDAGFGRRAISAKDPNSISGKATHDIWRRITKGKVDLQKRIIAGLKRELENRRSNNTLAYLQGIDTWLRQATWEKWEDVSEEKKSSGYTKL
jgi:hypothetical protein